MGLHIPARTRRVALGGLGAATALVLSGCSAADEAQIRRLAMPESATKEAPHVYELWVWAWLAAMIVGVLVWGLIIYAMIRYRRRRGSTVVPVQVRYNLPIEVFYTIAPIMMVIVFFFFTVKTQDAVNKVDGESARADYQVTVVGQQWSWAFNYTEAADGKTVYEVGTTSDRPTLWLVKDKKVRINLYSPDVIHSFWVPAFLYKMDVVPGRDNHFTITPDRTGTYIGRCAELCGVYHSRMLFEVRVVTQEQYDQHAKLLALKGNTGSALGGENAKKQAGLEEEQTTGRDSQSGGNQ